MLVCGYSLEVNATSDMDFFMATSQVKLGLDVWVTNMAAITKVSFEHDDTQLESAAELAEQMREEHGVFDSGVESEFSIFITPKEDYSTCAVEDGMPDTNTTLDWTELTPFEVLLTAGKISCMLYGHEEVPFHSQLEEKSAKLKGGHRLKTSRSKMDLEWKADTQSTVTMSSKDSGLESIAGSVAQGAAQSSSYQYKIVPFLYAHFSQPHTLLNCHASSQKAELSCYDIVLKGACPGHLICGELCVHLELIMDNTSQQ